MFQLKEWIFRDGRTPSPPIAPSGTQAHQITHVIHRLALPGNEARWG